MLVRTSAAEAGGGPAARVGAGAQRPGLLRRTAGSALSRQRDVAVGALEQQLGLLALAGRFSGLRLLADPASVTGRTWALPRGRRPPPWPTRCSWRRTRPTWATWRVSHGRWAGHLATGLALGGGPEAAGLLGPTLRGATAPARLLAAVPTARGAALRQAVVERPAVGRSPLRARDVRDWAGEPSALGTVSPLDAVPHAVSAATARDAAWSSGCSRHASPRWPTASGRCESAPARC